MVLETESVAGSTRETQRLVVLFGGEREEREHAPCVNGEEAVTKTLEDAECFLGDCTRPRRVAEVCLGESARVDGAALLPAAAGLNVEPLLRVPERPRTLAGACLELCEVEAQPGARRLVTENRRFPILGLEQLSRLVELVRPHPPHGDPVARREPRHDVQATRLQRARTLEQR